MLDADWPRQQADQQRWDLVKTPEEYWGDLGPQARDRLQRWLRGDV